jgi:hypothetical protein
MRSPLITLISALRRRARRARPRHRRDHTPAPMPKIRWYG